MAHAVLLSSSQPSTDLRGWLAEAGFAVREHSLGSAPGVEFSSISVAVVEVGTQAEAAIGQTRRWRAELGDELLPIVCVLPPDGANPAARLLDAGADAVFARPLDAGVFLAQVRAAVRMRSSAGRVAARAAEARLLGEKLNRVFAQADREHAVAQRIRLALLQRSLPEVGAVRFAVCHRPRGRTGGDFYAVQQLDTNRLAFLVGDVIGPTQAGGLLGRFITETVLDAAHASPTFSAGELLAAANRALLSLALEDSPLVALLAGIVDVHAGELTLARAGLPAPVVVPASGEPATCAILGPFLGVAETTYPNLTLTLNSGSKLLIGTDGTRPAGDPAPAEDRPLLEAVARHRELSGQRFLDAVAADLLGEVQHEEDFTLLCVSCVR